MPGTLAEAVAHEYSHTELFLYQESAELFTCPAGDLFYSPWREDPRPLNGLFHGAYVFTVVGIFLTRLRKLARYERYWAYCDSVRYKVLRQVQIALDQIPSESLSEAGREVYCAMIADVRRSLDTNLPRYEYQEKSLQRHLNQWKESNPGLALKVREEFFWQRSV